MSTLLIEVWGCHDIGTVRLGRPWWHGIFVCPVLPFGILDISWLLVLKSSFGFMLSACHLKEQCEAHRGCESVSEVMQQATNVLHRCFIVAPKDTEDILPASHPLLLHPHYVEPWALHPFSLYTVLCWVQTSTREYWAASTCLYQAFSIAVAFNADTICPLASAVKANSASIILIRDQAVLEKQLVFHRTLDRATRREGQWYPRLCLGRGVV